MLPPRRRVPFLNPRGPRGARRPSGDGRGWGGGALTYNIGVSVEVEEALGDGRSPRADVVPRPLDGVAVALVKRFLAGAHAGWWGSHSKRPALSTSPFAFGRGRERTLGPGDVAEEEVEGAAGWAAQGA